MTFYNLHNSVKSIPKMQEMAFQGPLDLKSSPHPRGLLACLSLPVFWFLCYYVKIFNTEISEYIMQDDMGAGYSEIELGDWRNRKLLTIPISCSSCGIKDGREKVCNCEFCFSELNGLSAH